MTDAEKKLIDTAMALAQTWDDWKDVHDDLERVSEAAWAVWFERNPKARPRRRGRSLIKAS